MRKIFFLPFILILFITGFYLGQNYALYDENKQLEFYSNIIDIKLDSEATDVIVLLDVLELLHESDINKHRQKLIKIHEMQVSLIMERNTMLGLNKSKFDNLYRDAKAYQSKYCESDCLIDTTY